MIRPLRPFLLSDRVSAALLVIRFVAGLAFMFHGYGKIQNPRGWMGPDSSIPAVFQVAAAISEFGGGLAWILGLLTPLASLGLICTMAVAIWTHAVMLKDPFVASGPGGSYELATVYLAIALLLLLAGPGRFSLDHLFFGDRIRRETSPSVVA